MGAPYTISQPGCLVKGLRMDVFDPAGGLVISHMFPPTNQTFIVSNVPDAAVFWLAVVPVIYGPPSNLLLYIGSNAPLTEVYSNGTPLTAWWGQSNAFYGIISGSSVTQMTNTQFSILGANGPVVYLDPLSNAPSRFYQVITNLLNTNIP